MKEDANFGKIDKSQDVENLLLNPSKVPELLKWN